MTFETHNTNPVKTTKPRCWFRFRLRTLLVIVTVLSVSLGWVGWELDQRRREKVVVAWIEQMGGEVYFLNYFPVDKRIWWKKTKGKWFGERVRIVDLYASEVIDLSPLAELKNVEMLELSNTTVTDLSPLAELKNLKEVYLRFTQVSEEHLEELRLALPYCEIWTRPTSGTSFHESELWHKHISVFHKTESN